MQNMESYIYPHIDDDLFNIKLAKKEEFQDNRNDEVKDVTEYANKLCNQTFEIRPHQLFVKNFLSLETPYNSLLLYHGLGTGKTCSAINISEDMRKYNKEITSIQKILVVASPNVQENFKKQLFDENNLKEEPNRPGYYTLNSCIGSELLMEINPTNKVMDKSTLINEANRIINKHYEFMGYTKLSYLIDSQIRKKNLSQTFNGRLIIIDEVHNIRINEDDENKRIAKSLYNLVENTDNVRFLFLSATPMYNSYREILWLVNLMNMNDKRPVLKEKEVFDNEGNFLVDEQGIEIGKINFIKKITGYVSFVRGENPYTFPYRIYPSLFDSSKSLLSLQNYPRFQYNGEPILEPLQYIDVYVTTLEGYQQQLYEHVSYMLFDKQKSNNNEINIYELENKGYLRFQRPLNVLNIAYPNSNILKTGDKYDFQNVSLSELLGKSGLQNIIQDLNTFPYKYNSAYLENGCSIFHPTRLKNYSSKMNSIINTIIGTNGIHLVYSQFIYGGIIPIVCALEEQGYSNFKKDKQFVDSNYKKKVKVKQKENKYMIITGNQNISGNIKEEINEAISEANKNGEIIKVILISKAGSEGIDFKNIRNVHILEPWYNMNRSEQIIGRAIRNCSHKHLPFSKRNVNIYMYGTILPYNKNGENVEAIDMYIYRSAEIKAIKIGAVSRILKETAIDCLLQENSQDMSESKMNQIVKQELPNNQIIDYSIGDKSYTTTCDYMESCSYKCKAIYNNDTISTIEDIVKNEKINLQNKSYNSFRDSHLQNNIIILKDKIKSLFVDKYVFTKNAIEQRINANKSYHPLQITLALHQLTNDKLDIVVDKYDRKGFIIEIDNTYYFQPYKIGNKKISMEHRITPVFQKRKFIPIKIDKSKQKNENINNALIVESKQFSIDNFMNEFNEFFESHDWNNYIKKSVLDKSSDIVKQYYIDYLKIIDNVSDDVLIKYVMHQFIDKLSYNKFIELSKFYYTIKIGDNNSDIDNNIRNYLDKFYFTSEFYDGFIANNGLDLNIFVYDKINKLWQENNNIYNQLQEEIDSVYKIPLNSPILGYYLPNKANKLNFKLKNENKSQKRSTSGAICRNMDNIYIQQFIEEISKYISQENQIKFRELLKVNSKITNNNLCNLIELILRHFQYNNFNGSTWVVPPFVAVFNKKYFKIHV